ncbi:ATP-binding cassette domain-containing protein [Nocardioidaceae bacterium SCSIO 66511]|nr:ATP-binding cassette domain-containing protein [Nocardioidaceae bacterium SCSIO 66511]
MSSVPPSLINLERVEKAYGVRPLLHGVSLGVAAGQRIGVVGRNGSGKTTLLRVLAGREHPDSGRVSHANDLVIGYLAQHDEFDDTHSVREAVLGGRADHEWAADRTTREVVEVLLAGLPLDRMIEGLSGGERRRASLARLLLEPTDLLLLDEPTNHLDIDAIAWLAGHLASRRGALVVVTHDRWFLDEVCSGTWEVHDGAVDQYEGGYAAFVLAKAERQRQAEARDTRRRNLMRKELAWLRRGPPARTSKPQFRIDAANALIADEPPPRDRLELERFATNRLGKDVVDLEHVDLTLGGRTLLDDVTWRLGPGERVGLVGPNGIGKSSVLRLVSGDLEPDAGRVKRGRTVEVRSLSQTLGELEPGVRVLDSVRGNELTASRLLESFGFTGDLLTARIGDLSGGERRRLQLLRLLLEEPNVLLLDEPTNDLDIETLNVLEDYLDGWPGTLVVVSHDRYFLDRVTDVVYAVRAGGRIEMLVQGISGYHAEQRFLGGVAGGTEEPPSQDEPTTSGPSAAEVREARKAMSRIDRQLTKLATRSEELHEQMIEQATQYECLAQLQEDLARVQTEREALEEEWLEAAEIAGD